VAVTQPRWYAIQERGEKFRKVLQIEKKETDLIPDKGEAYLRRGGDFGVFTVLSRAGKKNS